MKYAALLFVCTAVLVSPGSAAQGDSVYNLYVGNLHSHTSYSDGVGTPAQAFEYARDEAGIDYLAVTDHHNYLTPQEYTDILYQADVFTEDGVFIGIGGQEWTGLDMNHSTVWDAPYILTAPQNDYDSLYREVYGIGCTAAFCHPVPHNFGYFAYSAIGDVGVNAVEVRNQQEEERYIDILNKGWHVGTDGSQDNHHADWGNGNTWTVALACSLTRAHILEATREHRTYSTMDRNLYMIFRAEGRYMGDEFAHTDNIEFAIDVNDPETLDDFQRLELYQNGIMIHWVDIDTTSFAWAPVITPPNGVNHYFVKAYQKMDERAWSGPIWIDCATSLPATPRPESPYDGETVPTLRPTFIWHTSVSARSYTLQISTSDAFPLDGSTWVLPGIRDTVYTLQGFLEDDVWHYWRVRAWNTSGNSTYSGVYSFITDGDASFVPADEAPSLTPRRGLVTSPNPFGEETVIEFALERAHDVEVSIYGVSGRRVKTVACGRKGPGLHRAAWDGTDSRGRRVPPGVYLCRLRGADLSMVKKVVLLE